MDDQKYIAEIRLMGKRIDRLERALEKILEVQSVFQDFEVVDKFFWDHNSDYEIENSYPVEPGENFAWLGPKSMTTMNLFLRKEANYYIKLNIVALPSGIKPEDLIVTVDKKPVTINIEENNIYKSSFTTGTIDKFVSVSFGVGKSVNPAQMGIGSDNRDLSLALHSIIVAREV